jgi:hypothetical protein
VIYFQWNDLASGTIDDLRSRRADGAKRFAEVTIWISAAGRASLAWVCFCSSRTTFLRTWASALATLSSAECRVI